jgi:hypothetical protein
VEWWYISGKVLQHPIGVPMGTDCADLFLHAYKADFLQGFLKNEDRKLAPTFNSNQHNPYPLEHQSGVATPFHQTGQIYCRLKNLTFE